VSSPREIFPGVFHWTALHPRIGTEVSSYYVAPDRTLIDPLEPDEGLDWWRERGERPELVLLTNRHHLRHSERFAEAFGPPIRCNQHGLHEFQGGPAVESFGFGERLTAAITAHEVGTICDEETALHIEVDRCALSVADGIVNYGGIRFVPDALLGDDPEGVKRGLVDAYGRLLELDFEHLLFAHGDPIVADGRRALEDWVESRRA